MFLYAYPKGYSPVDPKFYGETEIDPGVNGSGLPFVSWRYTGGKAEPSYAAKQANNPNAWYGPGSNHPTVANHLYGDLSIHSISKNIDAAAYYFMITRSGADPAPQKQ